MAEEIITIARVDINYDAAVKDTAALKQRQLELKKQINDLKKANKEGTAEFVKANAQLKANNQQLLSNENQLKALQQTQTQNTGTLAKLRAQNAALRKEQEKLNLSTKEGVRRNKEIVKTIDGNTKTLQKNSDQFIKAKVNVGNYTNSLGALSPALGSAASAATALGAAFKFMLGPVGLIIAGVAAMVSYFKRGEEGQNRWAKAVAVFNVVLDNLLDIVDKAGEAIVDAFSKPQETVKALWEIIQTQVMNRLTAVADTFKALGDIIAAAFTLDADQMTKGLKDLGDAQLQMITGVEDFAEKAVDAYESVTESVGELVEEVNKDIEATKKLADQQAELEKIERRRLVETAKLNKEVQDLRLKEAERDKFTAKQRIGFINEAIEKQLESMEIDLDIARQKEEIHRKTIDLTKSDKDALNEQARLEANIFEIQQRNAQQRRRLQNERVAALNQIIAEEKKAAQEQIKIFEQEFEMWKLNNQSKLDDSKMLTEELVQEEQNRLFLLEQARIEILDQQFENELISQEEYNLKKRELELENLNETQALKDEFALQQKTIEEEKLALEKENERLVLEEELFGRLEFEKQALELSYQQEIEAANKLGADTTKIEEKYANARKRINQAEYQAKLSVAAGFAQDIAIIAGEQTKVGKAAAVAATTIETIKSGVAAFSGMVSTIPGPVGLALGGVAAAAALVSGYASVKKILAVNPKTGSGGSGATAPNISTATASAAQSQNIETTQAEIGQGITSRDIQGSEIQQPTTVLVVDDVTAAQESEDLQVETSNL